MPALDRRPYAGVPNKLPKSRPQSASPAPGGDDNAAPARDSALPSNGNLTGKPPRPLSANEKVYSTGAHVQACVVCRMDPLVFHECPDCTSRYCASGCLQSWYEHGKKDRALPVKAEVVMSEIDFVQAQLPNSEGDSNADGGETIGLALTRIAGGTIIGEDDDASTNRRWGITSVDGWAVGQPGPGSEWQPGAGVMLTLEELGSCFKCRKPLAVAEYICNSASKDGKSRASSRGRASSVQKPRVRTAEVGTQTEQDTEDAEIQATPMTADAEVQAPLSRETVARAQVAIAGSALAELAAPANGKDELELTANRALTKRRIQEALVAVARVAADSDGGAATTATDIENLYRTAEGAIRLLPGAAGADTTDACTNVDSTRVLGHKRRVALPRFVNTADGNGQMEPQFEAEAASALAGGALTALIAARASGADSSSSRGPSLPASLHASKEVDEHATMERLLLGAGATSSAAAGSLPATSGFQERLCDALANVAALLCTEAPGLSSLKHDTTSGGVAYVAEGDDEGERSVKQNAQDALAALARLLPPAPRCLPWRQIASAEAWPWSETASGCGAETQPPRGWLALREALVALASLCGGRGLCDLAEVVQALARLALFIDAEAQQIVDNQSAAEAAEAEARALASASAADENVRSGAQEVASAEGGATASDAPAAVAEPPPMDDPGAGQSMLDAFLQKKEAAPVKSFGDPTDMAAVLGGGGASGGLGGGGLGGATSVGGGAPAGGGNAKDLMKGMADMFGKKKKR